MPLNHFSGLQNAWKKIAWCCFNSHLFYEFLFYHFSLQQNKLWECSGITEYLYRLSLCDLIENYAVFLRAPFWWGGKKVPVRYTLMWCDVMMNFDIFFRFHLKSIHIFELIAANCWIGLWPFALHLNNTFHTKWSLKFIFRVHLHVQIRDKT